MGQGLWSKVASLFSSTGPDVRDEEESGSSAKNRNDEKVRFAVYMPSAQEDALRSAEAMKNGSGVVINGEYLDDAGYQRVMDFMDGAAYVLGGSGRRVSDTVQVYVPATIGIVDEGKTFYGNLTSGKSRSDA